MAVETAAVTEARYAESRGSSVSWGAIFCGALIALATLMVFTLLGSAIGLSLFDPERGDKLGAGAGIGAGIYLLLSTLVSFYAGGYVAGRLSGFKLRMASALHGLTAWALVTAFFTFMLGSTVGGLFSGATNLIGGGVRTAAQGVQQGGISEQSKNEIRESIRQGKVDQESAAAILSAQLGISQDEANRMIGQVQSKAGQAKENVQAKGGEIAGKATNIAAGGSWIAFFTMFLSAIASALGGIAGSALKGRKDISQPVARVDRRAA